MWTIEKDIGREVYGQSSDLGYIVVEDNWQLLPSYNLFLVLMMYIFRALPVI
jgi:hypothetical protein